MIDLRYVKKLIEIIDESTVDSIEITSDKGMKIRISKSPQQRGTVQVATPVQMPAIVPAAPVGRISPPQGIPVVSDDGVPAAEPAKPAGLEVKSPMVGTYLQVAGAGRQSVRRRSAIVSPRGKSSASSRR